MRFTEILKTFSWHLRATASKIAKKRFWELLGNAHIAPPAQSPAATIPAVNGLIFTNLHINSQQTFMLTLKFLILSKILILQQKFLLIFWLYEWRYWANLSLSQKVVLTLDKVHSREQINFKIRVKFSARSLQSVSAVN